MLQSIHISYPEAKTLIGHWNARIAKEKSYITILNGTIYHDGLVIGTMVTEVFEVLEGVHFDDEKDCLMLWIDDLDKIIERAVAAFPESISPSHIVIDDTPADADWRSLQLRFIDGRTLYAGIASKSWARNGVECSQLGLEKKGGRPKEQWHILEEAAANKGLIKLSSSKTAKESKRKQINLLKTLLKEVFPRLTGEPLEPLGGDAYQVVFEILPEQREERAYLE